MAHFKTAYLQREIVMDVKVSKDLKVGDLVSINEELDTITAATLADADYIVAQSDMTLNRRDYTKSEYEYSDVVKASTGTAKKVALFHIYESDDIIVTGKETV